MALAFIHAASGWHFSIQTIDARKPFYPRSRLNYYKCQLFFIMIYIMFNIIKIIISGAEAKNTNGVYGLR